MPLSERLLGITSPPGLSPGLTQRYGDAQFMPGEKLRGCPTTSLLSIAWQPTPCSSDYIKAKNCCMLQQLSGEAAGFRDAVISQMSSSVDLVFVYTRIILSSLFCLNFFFRCGRIT